MELTAINFNLVLIYFIYGLAFFSLGLTMLIEAGRSPLLAEARVLRPLALFGFIHGFHEWLEMGLLVAPLFTVSAPDWFPLLRLTILVGSFGALLVFALQVLRPQTRQLTQREILISIGLPLVYVVFIVVTGLQHRGSPTHWMEDADGLARYLLAVPASAMAAAAFMRHALQVEIADRRGLTISLHIAGLGFGLYSLTQVFVPPGDIFLAPSLNAQKFILWTGIPIQLVRAVIAAGITFALYQATQIVERERRRLLATAQKERLQALEQAQIELEHREYLRGELLRRTVEAQEDERARIAHELHDETAQFLTAMGLNLATIENSCEGNLKVIELAIRLQALCRDMSAGIYRMVHDLRPAQLDDLGLVPALRYLVDEMGNRSGLEVKFSLSGSRQRLDPVIETVIFRVAQEGLANVARHAGCDRAVMHVEYKEHCLKLEIIDQGRGFDPDLLNQTNKGLGLEGMRERVKGVNGVFELRTAPGNGTRVTVMVPFGGIASEGVIEEHCNGNDQDLVGR